MTNRPIVEAIDAEYRRYKVLAERALDQISDADLHARLIPGNSIAILLQHLGGNLKSRFTDFLTSDGEKPWRERETEFAQRNLTRAELMKMWNDGWDCLFGALADLNDDQLQMTVTIRGAAHSVIEALARSLAHTSQHVGQIVLLAKGMRGNDWKYLSIPPGKS